MSEEQLAGQETQSIKDPPDVNIAILVVGYQNGKKSLTVFQLHVWRPGFKAMDQQPY